VAGCFEHGNETPCTIKGGKFLGSIRNYWLLKKVCSTQLSQARSHLGMPNKTVRSVCPYGHNSRAPKRIILKSDVWVLWETVEQYRFSFRQHNLNDNIIRRSVVLSRMSISKAVLRMRTAFKSLHYARAVHITLKSQTQFRKIQSRLRIIQIPCPKNETCKQHSYKISRSIN
jgi:hypothetical protein